MRDEESCHEDTAGGVSVALCFPDFETGWTFVTIFIFWPLHWWGKHHQYAYDTQMAQHQGWRGHCMGETDLSPPPVWPQFITVIVSFIVIL